jgi:hypothetical protein
MTEHSRCFFVRAFSFAICISRLSPIIRCDMVEMRLARSFGICWPEVARFITVFVSVSWSRCTDLSSFAMVISLRPEEEEEEEEEEDVDDDEEEEEEEEELEEEEEEELEEEEEELEEEEDDAKDFRAAGGGALASIWAQSSSSSSSLLRRSTGSFE